MRAPILAVALLAACSSGQPVTDTAANEVTGEPVPAASDPLEAPTLAAKAVKVSEENDLYEFEYGWSAEAAAVPRLDARFRKDMEEAKAELTSGAKEDRDERTKQGYDYHPHATHMSYETAGQSERLLSLGSTVYGFTGGAHGSSGSGSLLWDRQLSREIALQDLLQPGQSWTGAIRQPFCVLLNREREKRREEPVEPDDLFGNCPELKELTVLLSDGDKNGRFDHVTVTADQYVAGPYAEGPYDISLPITAKMVERLKPEYSSSFEPKPPVR
jgi:Deacetylase PdaC